MKWSKEFLNTLKTFNLVSGNMYFVEGTIQTTCRIFGGGALGYFMRGITDVEIDKPFGVFNLSELIETVKTFHDPDIIVNDDHLLIQDVDKTVTFKLTDPENLKYHTKPDVVRKLPGATAKLTKIQSEQIKKLCGIFKSKFVSFQNKGDDFVVTITSEDRHSNAGTFVLGKTDEKFKYVFKSEMFQVPEEDYDVVIPVKPFVYLGSPKYEIFIPVIEEHSKR